MGDRVAILRDGVLQQLGNPEEIYDNPVDAFVAGFIGSPSMNLITARWMARARLRHAPQVPAPVIGARPGLAAYAGRRSCSASGPGFRAHGDGAVELKVNRVQSLGSELMAYLDGGEPGVELMPGWTEARGSRRTPSPASQSTLSGSTSSTRRAARRFAEPTNPMGPGPYGAWPRLFM